MAQHTRPAQWANLWKVSGWRDEHPHAQKLCEVMGYERTSQGDDCCKVRFLDRIDLFDPETALLPPHMLLPVRPS